MQRGHNDYKAINVLFTLITYPNKFIRKLCNIFKLTDKGAFSYFLYH